MADPDLAWYEELRQAYRPRALRLLLVGESPPDPGSGGRRFFYAPTLTHDNLYRGVVAAIYGDEAGFDPTRKTTLLERLRRDGVWLIDAVDEPIDKRTSAARRRAIAARAPHLADRVKELAPTIGVIICHSVVFEVTAPVLRSSGIRILHDTPLPFPLGNWRAQFVDGVRAALASTSWSTAAR
jgi:hypothetical protein